MSDIEAREIKFRAVIEGKTYYFDLIQIANAFTIATTNQNKEEAKKYEIIYNWIVAGNIPDQFIDNIHDNPELAESK